MPKQKLKNKSFTMFLEFRNLTKKPASETYWDDKKRNKALYQGDLYIEGKFIRHFILGSNSLNKLQLDFKTFIQNATKDAYDGNFPKTH